jgi:uncharacterized membrane protein
MIFNMEPEINEVEGHLAPLKKVTPLSKCLALALFVILPFLGGWIGYTYAPEKVVEVKKIVEVDRVAEEEKSIETEQDTLNGTDSVSDNTEIIDWAEFNISSVVNPYAYNQIRWEYNGNIFSALPSEKTYALFAVVDQQGNVVYSSVVGDGLSIDGSVNNTTWGNDSVFVPAEDLYGKLKEGEQYRYKVTLGYASEPVKEQAFKDLAARHVSYSDWFFVNWDNSVNQSVIESGDVIVYQGDRVVVIVADVQFGLGDSERIVTNFNPNSTILKSIIAAFETKGMDVGYASNDVLQVTFSDDVYSGDDIIFI